MKNQVKKHGGKRSGAGRPKGSMNKATADIRALAQEHTDEALSILLSIARDNGASEAARVAAAKDILDRGHGKPRQSIEHTGEGGGPVQEIRRIIVRPEHESEQSST